jgi:thiol-disulfide isomerase/thioredoxin
MVYFQSNGLSNEELFQKAFADRFASLDSLVSSSPASEGPCRPCGALLRMQMPGIGLGGAAPGGSLLQWALFFGVLLSICLALYAIFCRMRRAKRPSGVPAPPPPSPAPSPLPPRPSPPGDVIEDVSHPSRVKVTSGDRPAVSLLHADWCGHCKKMLPAFRALAQKYSRHCDFRMCESEVLKGSPLLTELNLKGFPMTLALKNNAVVDQMVGGRELPELEQFVKKLIGQAAA